MELEYYGIKVIILILNYFVYDKTLIFYNFNFWLLERNY